MNSNRTILKYLVQGLGTELFTDAGKYRLSFEKEASLAARASALSALVAIDSDYFSQLSMGWGASSRSIYTHSHASYYIGVTRSSLDK